MGFTRSEIARIEDVLNPAVPYLCKRWEEIHGEP